MGGRTRQGWVVHALLVLTEVLQSWDCSVGCLLVPSVELLGVACPVAWDVLDSWGCRALKHAVPGCILLQGQVN